MINKSDVKVGDKIQVTLNVSDPSMKGGFWATFDDPYIGGRVVETGAGKVSIYVELNEIDRVIPQPLKVGDRVQHELAKSNADKGTIAGFHDDMVWVKMDGAQGFQTWALAYIKRI